MSRPSSNRSLKLLQDTSLLLSEPVVEPHSRSQIRMSLADFDYGHQHTYGRAAISTEGYPGQSRRSDDSSRIGLTHIAEPTRSNPAPFSGFREGYDELPHLEDLYHPTIATEQFHTSTTPRRYSYGSFGDRTGSPVRRNQYEVEYEHRRRSQETHQGGRRQTQKRPHNLDEFDGPTQFLPLPLPEQDRTRAQELVDLPVHLTLTEQDDVMGRLNDVLAECAFHFVAKYQFPVPIEPDKPRVRLASDRDWYEWAYLIKRLATKRRIPARVLYGNQIRQLVTILDHSIPPRQSSSKDRPQASRKGIDDRLALQLVSAGIQVAKILMDSVALQQSSDLYTYIEAIIIARRRQSRVRLEDF